MAALYQKQLPSSLALHQLPDFCAWVDSLPGRVIFVHTGSWSSLAWKLVFHYRINSDNDRAKLEDLQSGQTKIKKRDRSYLVRWEWLLRGLVRWSRSFDVLCWHFCFQQQHLQPWLPCPSSDYLQFWRSLLLWFRTLHAKTILLREPQPKRLRPCSFKHHILRHLIHNYHKFMNMLTVCLYQSSIYRFLMELTMMSFAVSNTSPPTMISSKIP